MVGAINRFIKLTGAACGVRISTGNSAGGFGILASKVSESASATFPSRFADASATVINIPHRLRCNSFDPRAFPTLRKWLPVLVYRLLNPLSFAAGQLAVFQGGPSRTGGKAPISGSYGSSEQRGKTANWPRPGGLR